jgi:YqjK-like protein
MANDAATLALRREALLRRSAELRSRIIDDAAAISSRLRVVDKVTAFLRSGSARTALWGGALLLLAVGPSRVVKVSGRAAIAWSLIRKGLPLVAAFWRGSRRD